MGDGVQLAVYPAGCNDSPIGCNGGCSGCGTTPQSVSVAMVPGVNYYLLVDGFSGDECDITITVSPPTAVQANPLGPSGNLSAPATICPGGTTTFTMPTVQNAGFYTWSSPTPGVLFNGVESPATFEAPDGRTVQVTVPSGYTGAVTICCEPASSCFTGTERCRTINVVPLAPTNLPKAVVCNEDAPYTLPWGDEVTASGNYSVTFESYQGCDSIVNQTVQVLPAIIKNVTRYVCYGDCVTVCNEEFCDQGFYQTTCPSYLMCDSMTNLTLNVLNPIAQITGPTVLSCAVPSVTLTSAPPAANSPSVSVKVWRVLPSNAVVGNGENLVVTQPGTYYLTTTMSAGGLQCTQRDTVVVTGNTTSPTASGVNGVIGCSTGAVQIGVTTNASPATYSWSGNGLSSAVQNPSVTSAGTYTVTVTSGSNGCTATATAVVSGNTTPPSVTTSGAVLTCASPVLPVSATSSTPSTFSWGGPSSGTGPVLTVNAGGTYIVTVTSTSNGCTSVASAAVTEDFAPPGAVASAGGTISCLTPSVPLTGTSPSAGATYSWSTGSTSATSVAPVSGTYTVTVTGPNGCTSTSTVSVSGNTVAPVASATGAMLDCGSPSQTVTATSPSPGATFSWVIGGTAVNGPTAVVSAPGTYVVTVTSPNDCTSTASASVSGDFSPPGATASGATINCGVNTVEVTGGSPTAGVSYSWVGPGGTPYIGQTASVSAVGAYTLVVTAPNGCTSTAVAQVVPDANVPNVSATGDTINCVNSGAVITGSSQTPGVVFEWTYGGSPLPNPSVAVQPVTQPGLYTLTVVNPGNGCTAVATAFVTLDTSPPGASATGGTLTCSSSSLDLTATSPTVGVSYSWPGGSSSQVLGVGSPGLYTVTVTAPNGCTSTAAAAVQADQGIPVLSASSPALTCAQPIATISTTTTVPSDFQWTGPSGFVGTSSQSPQVTLPGTYTVLAVNPLNGCSSTLSVTVLQDTVSPGASASGGVLTCSSPSLALTGSSPTAGASYSWPALGTSQQSPSVSASGSYVLEVTGPNGCVSTATAAVSSDMAPPSVGASTSATLTCSVGQAVLSATATSPGGSAVSTYLWSTGSQAAIAQATSPGVYTVTVTLGNGCTGTAAVSVLQDTVAPQATALGGTLTCSQPSVQLTGTTGTPGSSLSWSGGLPPTATPTVTSAGSYVLTVTGPNGCTKTAVAQVPADTVPPGASVSSSNVIDCTSPEATLAASTALGVLYQWSGPNVSGASSPSVVAQSSGTYTVVVSGPNGCTSSATVSQGSDLVPPGATALGDTLDCTSGFASLIGGTPSAGAAYLWGGPGGFSSPSASPTVSEPGLYALTVTGLNGCTSTAVAEIAENTLSPDASITASATLLTCSVVSVGLLGVSGTPGAVLSWTLPGGSSVDSSSVSATVPGVYLLEVVSPSNGCVSSRTLTVQQDTVAPTGVSATGGTLDCTHPSVSLSGTSGTPGASYSWTGPGGEAYTGQAPPVSAPGTYALVVTDPSNGCTSSSSASVLSSTDLPSVTASSGVLTCTSPSTVLDAGSDVQGASYSWSGPQFSSTSEDPSVSVAGTYTVTVTNPSNGCSASYSLEVSSDQASPGASAQGVQLSCQQPQAAIVGSSPTAGATYLWTGPGGATYPVSSPTVGQPGTYTLVVTDPSNGCTSSATAAVLADQNIPVVTVTGGLLTCSTPSVDLVATVNKPSVEWSWSGPGGFSSTEQSPEVSVAGTYVAVATTPANGCSGQYTIVVAQDTASPSVSVAPPGQLNCTVSQLALVATASPSGTVSYSWATADGSILSGSGSATPTVGQAGQYTVVVTDASNGCTSSATAEVGVDPAVPSGIAHAVSDISCYGRTDGSVSIGGVTGGTPPYLFSVDNGPFVSAGTFSNLGPGGHSLQVQDANGCEFETVFPVAEPAELLVDLGPDTTISLGDSLTLTVDSSNVSAPLSIASTALSPSYLDTLLGVAFLPKYTLQYKLTAVDTNGCRASDTRVVIVDRTRHVYVPNLFYPDGSGGINSLLHVYGGRDVESFRSFAIYDRWGEMVYQARNFAPTDNNVYWDGRHRGRPVDPAVYVYVLEVLFKDGEVELFTGDVTVAR